MFRISEVWGAAWRQVWQQEAWARGVRAVLALASVMAAGLWLAQPQAVIPLLLGVIASALAETDDSWRGRLQAQLATLLSFALIALAVQASLAWPGLFAAVLVLAAFGLTLVGALGERYRAMAFATLILALYAALAAQPGRAESQGQVALLLAGAAWYGLISVLWAAALPMLPVRQNLTRLYEVLGEYLQLKARMFEPVRGIDLERRRLALALHNGRVVEALNATKESLFSRLGRGAMPAWLGEAMRQYFVAQDVHERASSSHAHYGALAESFFHSDVLYRCQRVLGLLGRDAVALAQALREHRPPERDGATARALEDLAASIRFIESGGAGPATEPEPHALRALQALAQNLAALEQDLAGALAGGAQPMPADSSLHDRQPRSLREAWQRVRAQLALSSPLMRHALRLSVALAAGDALMRATGDRHGVWILLTIVFVCQPQYGATLKRLAQRIGGTVLGLVVGWALLRLFPGLGVQAAFTVAAGVLFFVTRQTHYTLATAAITALVLLSFHQVGDGFGLIRPRLLDTLAGSVIAGLAVWLVLPSWQSRQLPRLAAQTLRAQAQYLREIMAQYRGGKQDHLAYRLARRNAHNADAALSNALSAAFQEPGPVRGNAAAGTRFLVLSHTLLNYLSALGAHREAPQALADDAPEVRAVDGLLATLQGCADRLAGASAAAPAPDADWLSGALSDAGEATLPERRRVLRAQLLLALKLLPPLQDQAAALAAPPVTSPGVPAPTS